MLKILFINIARLICSDPLTINYVKIHIKLELTHILSHSLLSFFYQPSTAVTIITNEEWKGKRVLSFVLQMKIMRAVFHYDRVWMVRSKSSRVVCFPLFSCCWRTGLKFYNYAALFNSLVLQSACHSKNSSSVSKPKISAITVTKLWLLSLPNYKNPKWLKEDEVPTSTRAFHIYKCQ